MRRSFISNVGKFFTGIACLPSMVSFRLDAIENDARHQS